jgi:ATP-binding cassette subfamily F protein uup
MLLTARNLSKSFGPRRLFAGITLGITESERIGLIGANGSGKSTLLRIFAGLESADEGELISRRQLRLAYVPQEDALEPGASALKLVAEVMDEHLDEHERDVRARIALDRAGFGDPLARAEALSGGWRKRLAIVRQLARGPELLILDEPTNHLDLEGILWLEEQIVSGQFATLAVSHDRRFLEETASRIIELGRQYPQGFLSHNGTYSEFVEKREEFLDAQAGRARALASTVRREIQWLRRGAKARTTKAKGRIDRAGEMMDELSQLRARSAQQAAAKIDFSASGRKTRKLLQAEKISKSLGGRKLFEDLSFVLSPGTRLGLLGPNGSGKSTLIKLLTAELPPDTGQIIRADLLKTIVFDQHREQLDQTQTLRKALWREGDTVTFQGSAMHITAWAKRFLFRSEQLDLPVSELSGGEQARVLIARLMLREADVLILDEPTNDLDISTLDVLEESLEQFAGALVLVTHDRYLLDRISTELLALDGKGNSRFYADLSQWESARESESRESVQRTIEKPSPAKARAGSAERKRLTWNEQRELERMESAILDAEANVEALQARVSDPQVLADHVKSHEAFDQLAEAQHEVERLYARWGELDARK